ncbi:hypothetical protein B9Z55_022637 [Caenorhabditis nigoni]|uniref:Reverse transcriptase domain-containing protein n=1 Tax=Caenorhabditis nigoni TaxID=1611254 RepID=A0A2G5SLK3_9PELO|nr:hypothetical protein B9Z55_022637 [Caenorhabditis nigoni]
MNLTINEIYENLIAHLKQALKISVQQIITPLGSTSLPTHLVLLEKEVAVKYDIAQITRNIDDFKIYVVLARKFRKNLAKFKGNEELKKLEKYGTSKFSRFSKSLLKPKTAASVTLTDATGTSLKSDEDKSNLLADSYEKQYTNPRTEQFNLPPNYVSHQPFIYVTDDEVYKRICAAKSSCSDTSDEVPFKFIKLIAPLISSALAQFFNLTMMKGCVPSRWKSSIIIPLPKKSKPTNPVDYRPISLTSHLCRLYERCILSRLASYLDERQFWSMNQHGFRAKKSTVTNMMETLNDWTNIIENKGQVDVIYLDFSKAFDKIPHDRLLNKLLQLKLNAHLLMWIDNFLSDRNYRVKVGTTLSCSKPATCGVPQGAVLSPVLFGIYVNEISSILPSEVRCKQFADDTKLYAPIYKNDSANPLQTSIDIIQNWSKQSKLPLNVNKTVALTLGKSNKSVDYFIEGQSIKKEKITRDLGFIVSDKLDFSEHWRLATNKSKYLLSQVFQQFNSKNTRLMVLLYKVFIRPVLEYGTCKTLLQEDFIVVN